MDGLFLNRPDKAAEMFKGKFTVLMVIVIEDFSQERVTKN